MKLADGSYIPLNAQNTQFRNDTNTAWISFFCPLPPPTVVTGGNLRANRLVDSNGYLWCAGRSVGVYEDGTLSSNTWRKVKYSQSGEYINAIKRIEAGGAISTTTPPTTLFMEDGRILFSGDASYGNRGNSTGNNLANSDSTVIDVTVAWNLALGSVSQITHFDTRGALIRDDGVPFVLGLTEHDHNDGSPDTYRGFLGAAPDTTYNSANNYVLKYAWRWKRPSYTPDGGTIQPLPQVVSMAKSTDEFLFVITASGSLLQPSYYERITSPDIPTPVKTTYAMRELYTAFTGGTPLRLHAGGFLETTTGDLFYHERKPVQPYLEYFQEFIWKPLNINVNSLGSPVKRISGTIQPSGATWTPTVFILLEDGRFLATGENLYGWFGNSSITKTAIGQTNVLQNGVTAFDLNGFGCIVMFGDGSMKATGFNASNCLGLGAGAPGTVSTWMPCIFS